MARGWRPSAVLEREGTVFPNMDRPRLVNNINFLFISKFFFQKVGETIKKNWKSYVFVIVCFLFLFFVMF